MAAGLTTDCDEAAANSRLDPVAGQLSLLGIQAGTNELCQSVFPAALRTFCSRFQA